MEKNFLKCTLYHSKKQNKTKTFGLKVSLNPGWMLDWPKDSLKINQSVLKHPKAWPLTATHSSFGKPTQWDNYGTSSETRFPTQACRPPVGDCPHSPTALLGSLLRLWAVPLRTTNLHDKVSVRTVLMLSFNPKELWCRSLLQWGSWEKKKIRLKFEYECKRLRVNIYHNVRHILSYQNKKSCPSNAMQKWKSKRRKTDEI